MPIYNNIIATLLLQNHNNSVVVSSYSYIASGGLTISNTASNILIVTYVPSGGMTFGESANIRFNLAQTGSGTLTFSGAASADITRLVYIGHGSIVLDGNLPDPIITIEGSIKLQGTATIRSERSYTGSGSITIGSTAICKPTISYTGSGGLTFSNSADFKTGYKYTGDGSMTLSDTALSYISNYITSGQLTFSNQALVSFNIPSSVSGGMTFSGSANVRFRLSHIASGGATFSGAADFIPFFTRIGEGTATLSGIANLISRYNYEIALYTLNLIGNAPFKVNYNYTGSGGITLSNAATVEFKLYHTATGGIVLSNTATAFIRDYKYIPKLGIIIGGTALASYIVYDYFYDGITGDSLSLYGSATVDLCVTDPELDNTNSVPCDADCNIRVGMLLVRPEPKRVNKIRSRTAINDAYVPAITVCNQKLWSACPTAGNYKNDFQKKKCTTKIFNSKH